MELTPLSKTHLWIVAGAVILLCIITFRGCDPKPKSLNLTEDSLREVRSKLAAFEAEKKIHIAQDVAYSTRMERRVDSLQKELEKRRVDISITRYELASVLETHKNAKAKQDTTLIVTNCDSMAKIARVQMEQFQWYQETSDSLYAAAMEAIRTKDSLIANHAALAAQFKTAFMNTSAQLDLTRKDLKGMTKKRNFNKTLTRGLAFATLVLGGILLTHK